MICSGALLLIFSHLLFLEAETMVRYILMMNQTLDLIIRLILKMLMKLAVLPKIR